MKAAHTVATAPTFAPRTWNDRRSVASQAVVWEGLDRRARSADRRGTIVALACPRCGHVDVMAARTYESWPDGILCGVCGPPYLRMSVVDRSTAGS
jgi:hypothetical protein